jgi:hypothetical protein
MSRANQPGVFVFRALSAVSSQLSVKPEPIPEEGAKGSALTDS